MSNWRSRVVWEIAGEAGIKGDRRGPQSLSRLRRVSYRIAVGVGLKVNDVRVLTLAGHY